MTVIVMNIFLDVVCYKVLQYVLVYWTLLFPCSWQTNLFSPLRRCHLTPPPPPVCDAPILDDWILDPILQLSCR